MELITKFAADVLLYIIVLGAGVSGIYYVVRHHQIRQFAPRAVMAALTSLYIAKLLSLLYQPSISRPYVEQGLVAGASYIDNPGFPSDHALLATVIVVMLFALTPYRKLSICLFVLVIAMSVGRVAALVHTPLDVIGGVLIGLIGAVWYLKRKH